MVAQVLLVDYSKRRADDEGTTTTPPGASPDHVDGTAMIGCQFHPHRNVQASQKLQNQIQAAQKAAASEEPDRVQPNALETIPLPLRYSFQTMPKFARCETSELVREHRNRRPTVLTELEASDSEMSMEEDDETPQKKNKEPVVDWSQPSRRTTPKKKNKRLSLLDSSLHSITESTPTRRLEDTISCQERDCHSLSHLHHNPHEEEDLLSFTLRRPARRAKSMDHDNSESSVSRFELSLTNLSLQQGNTHKNNSSLSALSLQEVGTRRVNTTADVLLTSLHSKPKKKNQPTHHSVSHLLGGGHSSSIPLLLVPHQPDEHIPTKIKVDFGASFTETKSSHSHNNPLSSSQKRIEKIQRKAKQRKKVAHVVARNHTTLGEPDQEEATRSKNQRMPSREELGYTNNEDGAASKLYNQRCSTQALPGYFSDGDSIDSDDLTDISFSDHSSVASSHDQQRARPTRAPPKRASSLSNSSFHSSASHQLYGNVNNPYRPAPRRCTSMSLTSPTDEEQRPRRRLSRSKSNSSQRSLQLNSSLMNSYSSLSSRSSVTGGGAAHVDSNKFVTGSRIRRLEKGDKLRGRRQKAHTTWNQEDKVGEEQHTNELAVLSDMRQGLK